MIHLIIILSGHLPTY